MEVKPFVSAHDTVREFTLRSIGIGILFSFFFAIANTYLGLKIGQTVSASIPAAILSLGLSRAFFRGRTTPLEHNIIQSIATMGEGMAGGIVFTLPALLLLGDQPPFIKVVLLSLLGGILGILFMIPMRRFLIVEEHRTLPYPEGTACAKIIMAGSSAGRDAMQAVYGFCIAGVYKILMNGFFLWEETSHFALRFLPGSRFSMDGTPALLGIGYLIGFRISSFMLGGGLLAWGVVIPLIAIFGAHGGTVYPGTIPIMHMTPDELWSNYVRYIGAGAVGTGGLIYLFKVLPLLMKAIRDGVKELFGKHHLHAGRLRTDQDISMKWLILGAVAVAILLWVIPHLSFNLFSIILLLILSLFFVAVSSIACGVVGSSSSPVSGMLITVLLITCACYLALGWTERVYLLSAITLSIVACVAIGLAGNTSQDLKAGFLLGSTPWKQQVAQIIGLFLPALVIGSTVGILNETYHIGSIEMPAPQANLLAMIAEGVIEKSLPIGLVTTGIAVGVILFLLEIPIIPFAIGLYLPLSLSTPIFVGGLARFFADRVSRAPGHGTLFASGLVGGDALIGVIIAIMTVMGIVPISAPTILPHAFSPLLFLGLGFLTYWISRK